MVINKNEFGKLSEVELNDFEIHNDIKLPEEYRNFLLDSNGGAPYPNRNLEPNTIVVYLFGMHNVEFYASLYKQIEMFMGRLPLSTFPIGSDPFGNLFIMSAHPDIYGHIYFWDHEGEPESQDGHYTENCTFVAYSFIDFINNLVESET